MQVTVFQAVRNPGRVEEFAFTVDASLINVTVYITGSPPLTFNLTSPSGDASRRGSLLTLQRLSLLPPSDWQECPRLPARPAGRWPPSPWQETCVG